MVAVVNQTCPLVGMGGSLSLRISCAHTCQLYQPQGYAPQHSARYDLHWHRVEMMHYHALKHLFPGESPAKIANRFLRRVPSCGVHKEESDKVLVEKVIKTL